MIFSWFEMKPMFGLRDENETGCGPLQLKTTQRGKIISRHALWRKMKAWER